MGRFLAVGVALLLLATPVAGASGATYVVLELRDRAELAALTRLVSIDRVEGDRAWAYAWPPQLERLRSLGYRFREVEQPPRPKTLRMGLLERAKSGSWDAYPTYAEYVQMMEAFASDHPDLCRLVDLGATTNQARPHRLLAVKISDNPQAEEDEPEVFLTSSMHGDEVTGYVLLLRLVDELLNRYDPASTQPYEQRITALVDGLEIWVNPLANPDGTYLERDDTVATATRFFVDATGNEAWVDPNRNFPDPAAGDHPDGNPWWGETMAMMTFASQRSFALSVNLHGGAEVVNYPWDTWARLHVDTDWFVSLSRAYADRAQAAASAPPYSDFSYLTDLDDGITNGYAWYRVTGGRQDFMTYWHGCRETTIEISGVKMPTADRLPRYWDYNRDALLGYLEGAERGVRGVVTDASGAPLDASVVVAWHDSQADQSWVHTDPEVGDFHRLLLPGSYWLVVSAEGFLAEVRPAEVGTRAATRVDVTLEPDRGLTTALEGSVLSAATGLPISGARVELVYPQQTTLVTAADGTFVVPSLPEGGVLAEVSAAGYAPVRLGAAARSPRLDLEVSLLREVDVWGDGGLRDGSEVRRLDVEEP